MLHGKKLFILIFQTRTLNFSYRAFKAYIALGAHHPQEQEASGLYVSSDDIIVHEDFNPISLDNDIAIIRLNESVTTDEYIGIVSLPEKTNTYSEIFAQVTGWGATDSDTNEESEVLLYTNVTVLSNENCGDILDGIESFHICAIDVTRTSSVCKGDDGGPLIADGVQIGMVSWVNSECDPKTPMVFTRISEYLDWIINNSS